MSNRYARKKARTLVIDIVGKRCSLVLLRHFTEKVAPEAVPVESE